MPETSQDLAQRILANANIDLATRHPSGVVDDATAKLEIEQVARGEEARRSSYGNAPGGTTPLGEAMLLGMLAIAKHYSIHVTEIAGASHSENSRHYAGVAFDIGLINGMVANAANPHIRAVVEIALNKGATEVRRPGDPGHKTHVHLAWPRP